MNKKKYIFKSLLIAFVCCFSVMFFSGIKTEAAMKKNAANVIKLYKQGKYKKAQKMAKKLPQSANEKCVKNMSAGMKKAYLKKVKSFKTFSQAWLSGKSYIWSYYLTDINNDKKAELIIQSGTCEADCKITVYTYKKGKAVKVGSLWASHTSYYAYPNKNGLVVQNAHMGNEGIYLITMKNMKLKSRLIGGRDVGTGEYLSLPYALDYHQNGTDIDYSALK